MKRVGVAKVFLLIEGVFLGLGALGAACDPLAGLEPEPTDVPFWYDYIGLVAFITAVLCICAVRVLENSSFYSRFDWLRRAVIISLPTLHFVDGVAYAAETLTAKDPLGLLLPCFQFGLAAFYAIVLRPFWKRPPTPETEAEIAATQARYFHYLFCTLVFVATIAAFMIISDIKA